MENVGVKDLDGALVIISCKTTNLDDAELISEYKFPFTFSGNELFCFQASPEDVDEGFDMSEYEVEHRGTYSLNKYKDLTTLADRVLTQEGVEYVKALYYDEELVVDNEFTFTLFNNDREVVFTRTKSVEVELPKPMFQEDEEAEPDEASMSRSLERTLEIHDDKFIYDRRIVLFHLFLLVAVTALVLWLGLYKGWTTLGLLLIPITSGLYFTQFWWSNAPREHLGVFENRSRRAKGRPWINGGFLVGLLAVVINFIYYCRHPEEKPIDYYMMWWMLTMFVTIIWGGLALAHRAMNKSVVDSMIDSIGIGKSVRRVGRKQFIRSFFLAMLPIDWEIKIRNKHIERLDREE